MIIDISVGSNLQLNPSVDRDVKPLVLSLNVLSGDLKEPTHLSIGVG